MATGEITNLKTTSTATVDATGQTYTRPLAIVTTLFFMWGFLTCLNDILVPHLKSIFDLSYARVMLIQFAFFSAYFLFSIPWSKVVNAIGYQKTMVAGLLCMAAGAFLFVPAASSASFPLFLGALIVLAAGITGLQVAANPYVVVLGKPETASSRLDLTQAFNSLGTTIAPKLGGLLILAAVPLAVEEMKALSPAALHLYRVQEAASVKMPYTVIGITLLLLAALIAGLLLAILIARVIARPLARAVSTLDLVAAGDLTARLQKVRRVLCRFIGAARCSGVFSGQAYCGSLRPGVCWARLRFVLHCLSVFRCSRTATSPCGASWPLGFSIPSCSQQFSVWGWLNSGL